MLLKLRVFMGNILRSIKLSQLIGKEEYSFSCKEQIQSNILYNCHLNLSIYTGGLLSSKYHC